MFKKNKKISLLIFTLVIFVIGVIFAKKGDYKWIDLEKFFNDYFINKTETPDWLLKIDDYVITKKDFNEGYQFFLQQLTEEQKKLISDESLIKKQYFNNLLMQNVVLIKVLQDKKILESDDFQTYIKLALRQAVYQYFIALYLPKDKNKFKPSDKEINDYYNQNKDKLLQMGLNSEQIKQYAIQDLSQQKAKLWLEDFLEQTKEEFKVKRNSKTLKEVGID